MLINELTTKEEEQARACLELAAENLQKFSKLVFTESLDFHMPSSLFFENSLVEVSGSLAEYALHVHNQIIGARVSMQPIMPAPLLTSRRRRDDFVQDLSFEKMKKSVEDTFFGSATIALLEGIDVNDETISSENLAKFLISALRGHDLLAAYPDNKVVLLLKDTGLPLAGMLIKRIQANVAKSDDLKQVNGVFLPFHAGTNRVESFTKALETIKPLIQEVRQNGGGMHPAIGTN